LHFELHLVNPQLLNQMLNIGQGCTLNVSGVFAEKIFCSLAQLRL